MFALSKAQLLNCGVSKLPLVWDTRCCNWRGSKRPTSMRMAGTLRANSEIVFSPESDSSAPLLRMLSSRGNSGTERMRSSESPST